MIWSTSWFGPSPVITTLQPLFPSGMHLASSPSPSENRINQSGTAKIGRNNVPRVGFQCKDILLFCTLSDGTLRAKYALRKDAIKIRTCMFPTGLLAHSHPKARRQNPRKP